MSVVGLSAFHLYSIVLTVIAILFTATPSVNAQSPACEGVSILTNDLPNTGIEVRLDGNFMSTEQVVFTVCFLNASGAIQNHVDYNFVIKDVEGEEIFNAASAAGNQSILHTAEGVVAISSGISGEQLGSAIVTIVGINFTPINPEDVTFRFRIPEFPASIVPVLAIATTSLVVVLTRYKAFTR